jgi:hypothetical protein
MKGVSYSWADLARIRRVLAADRRGDQKRLVQMRCVQPSTVSQWKAACDVIEAVEGKVQISELSAFQPSHGVEVARAFRRLGKDLADPDVRDEIADWVGRVEADNLTVRQLRRELARSRPPARPRSREGASPADDPGGRWSVEAADCSEWFAAQPADSLDLVFGSPPYESARLYLEDGEDLGIARGPAEEWVQWMADVYQAALRCCVGLVAFVVEGQTRDYAWTGAPVLLMAELIHRGVCLRKPPVYKRVGIPGSGGPDWLRNDYEFVVCATRGGRLPWSDNTAVGAPPKCAPGGDPSHRRRDGSRVNGDGYAPMEDRRNEGPHRVRQRAGKVYEPPELANPGNVIDCGAVGGGNMGDPLCHENEAPFPEELVEFFVRSFSPPDAVVCDLFSGSGTTGAVALRWGRRFKGCDLRASQVDLTRRRLTGAGVTPAGPASEEAVRSG